MVYVKAGLAATTSLATTAMAYNRYNEKDTTKTKNGGNYNQKMVFKNEGSKNKTGKKSHDETVKQMQMWKFWTEKWKLIIIYKKRSAPEHLRDDEI